MRGQPKGVDPDAFALQLDNAVNPFVPEHFKAADMHGAQSGYRHAAIERGDQHRGKIRTEINLAARDPLRCVDARRYVADIGKAFGPQQLLGHVLGERCRYCRPLGGALWLFRGPHRGQRWRRAHEACSAGQ